MSILIVANCSANVNVRSPVAHACSTVVRLDSASCFTLLAHECSAALDIHHQVPTFVGNSAVDIGTTT